MKLVWKEQMFMNIKQISLQHMGFWTLHPEALNQSEKCVGKIFDKITACKNSELKKKVYCTLCLFLCGDPRKLFNVVSWSSVCHQIFFPSLMT